MNAKLAKELSEKNRETLKQDLTRIMKNVYEIIRGKAVVGHTSVALNIESDWHKDVAEQLIEEGYNVHPKTENSNLYISW